MKKVLLIFPPFEGKSYLKSRFPFPIGLLYLAAYLEKHGIKASVIDMSYPNTMLKAERPIALKGTKVTKWSRYGWSDQEIKKWFEGNLYNYHNVIGISGLMSTNYTGFYRTVDILKNVSPYTTIIAGGPHATVEGEHIFRNSKVDYICKGEGEEVILSFLNGQDHPAIVGKNDNLEEMERAFIKGKETERAFIKDMDTLPFPKRHLLKDDRETPQMYLTLSRGCPHRCRFCGSYKIQGRKWRHKSTDRAIEEIQFYQQEWGAKSFIVEDDNLTPGKVGINYAKKLCEKILQKGIKTKFRISHGIPVYATADKELCDLLWSAGFRNMVFPLESSNFEVLKHMRKSHTFHDYEKAISNWSYEKRKATETIIGYPFKDTIQTMLQTIIDVTNQGAINWPSYFRLVKGSPLFITCIRKGYFDPKKYDPIMAQDFHLETDQWSIDDLREIRQIARAANFGVENGFNIFKDKPNEIKTKAFSFNMNGKVVRKDQPVAHGSFGFNRGQSTVAEVLVSRLDTRSERPSCSISKKKHIIFSQYKRSKVFSTLRGMTK